MMRNLMPQGSVKKEFYRRVSALAIMTAMGIVAAGSFNSAIAQTATPAGAATTAAANAAAKAAADAAAKQQ